MIEILLVALLALACAAGLLLVLLGLPGLWVMVLAVIGFGWLTDFRSVGLLTIGLVVGLAALGEVAETWVGFHFAKRYGGSSRAGWGALIGGIVGAVIGVPLPVVGSVVGAFVGAFLGAGVFEWLGSGRMDTAMRSGWGAVLGRAAAGAIKVALGLVIGVLALFAALRA